MTIDLGTYREYSISFDEENDAFKIINLYNGSDSVTHAYDSIENLFEMLVEQSKDMNSLCDSTKAFLAGYMRLSKITRLYINRSGDKVWKKGNTLHREDGPAIEFSNGTKKWYRDGKLHREDGPAIEYSDGLCYWFLNDERVSELEHAHLVAQKNIDEVT